MYKTKIGLIDAKRLVGIYTKLQIMFRSEHLTQFDLKDIGIPITIEQIDNARSDIIKYTDNSIKLFDHMSLEASSLYEMYMGFSLSNYELKPNNNQQKPIVMQLMKLSTPLAVEFDPTSLACWLKYPECRYLLPNTFHFDALGKKITELLDSKGMELADISASMLVKFCQKLRKSSKHIIYMYAPLPSDCRQLMDLSDFTILLNYNSFTSSYIGGVSMDTNKYKHEMFKLDVPKYREMLATINASRLLGIIKTMNLPYLNLNINFLDKKLKIKDLPDELLKTWKQHPDLRKIVELQICGVTEKLPDIYNCYWSTFSKRQIKKGKNFWVGKGIFNICTPNGHWEFQLDGSKITYLRTTHSRGIISSLDLMYINKILVMFNIEGLSEVLSDVDNYKRMDLIMGIDETGTFMIDMGSRLVMGFNDMDVVDDINTNVFSSSNIVNYSNGDLHLIHIEEFLEEKFLIESPPVIKSDLDSDILKMICNDNENNKILEGMSDDVSLFIKDYILPQTGHKLMITWKNLSSGIVFGKLYKLYYNTKDLFLPRPRELMQPASSPCMTGGFLDMLLEMKRRDPSFKLDLYNSNMGFLYELKVQTPIGFIPAIGEKCIELFEKVLNSTERETFYNEYKSLISLIQDRPSDLSNRMASMLTYWGYSALTGGIISYNFKRVSENYHVFRIYDENSPVLKYYADMFPRLMRILSTTFKDSVFTKDEMENLPANLRSSYQRLLLIESFCVEIILSSRLKRIRDDLSGNVALCYIFALIDVGFKNENFLRKLDDLFSKDEGLKDYPINSATLTEFKIMLSCLSKYWQLQNQNFIELTWERKNNSDNDITPILKNFLPNILVRHNFYNGVLDPKYADQIKRKHLIYRGKMRRFISVKIGKLSKKYVPINKLWKYESVLSEETLDGDPWGEMLTELESREPDIACYNENINLLKKEKNVFEKVNPDEVVVIYAFGKRGGEEYINYINQVGHKILIITDTFTPSYSNFKGLKLAHPKNNKIFYNMCAQSILLVGVRFDDVSNQEFENMFDCLLIKHLEVKSQSYYYGDGGELLTAYDYSESTYTDEMLDRALRDSTNFFAQSKEKFKRFHEENLRREKEKMEEAKRIAELDKDFNSSNEDLRRALLNTNLSENLINDILNNRRKVYEERKFEKLTTQERISKMLDLIVEGDVMKKVVEANKTAIETKLDTEGLRKMIHSPTYFSSLSSDNKEINKSIKDRKLYCELECFLGESLFSKLMMNNATIRDETRKDMLKNVVMMERGLMKSDPIYSAKKMMLDIFKRCIRDAYRDNEKGWTDSDVDWNQLRGRINDYIIPDSVLDEDDMEAELIKPEGGTIHYDLAI